MDDLCKLPSVEDFKQHIEQIWDDPTLSTYILREYETSMINLYAANKSKSRKGYLPDPEVLPQEVLALQKGLGGVKLQCMK